MTERLKCEFFLVRYVPDPIRAEFANIGVVLREAGQSGNKTVVRFTRNWARAQCLNPNVDTVYLEALEEDLRIRLNDDGLDAQRFLEEMENSFSNAVQLTARKGCLTESLADQIDQLMRIYVEPQHLVTIDGRRLAVHTAMRKQFEEEGLWEKMQKEIMAARYTGSGDPMRIDCGLPPNGSRLMMHAVSLAGELETAKALAYSMTAMSEGVKRIEGADLELTAIVEPLEEVRGGQNEGDRTSSYQFAVETMERHKINVVTTSRLPSLAKSIKANLPSF